MVTVMFSTLITRKITQSFSFMVLFFVNNNNFCFNKKKVDKSVLSSDNIQPNLHYHSINSFRFECQTHFSTVPFISNNTKDNDIQNFIHLRTLYVRKTEFICIEFCFCVARSKLYQSACEFMMNSDKSLCLIYIAVLVSARRTLQSLQHIVQHCVRILFIRKVIPVKICSRVRNTNAKLFISPSPSALLWARNKGERRVFFMGNASLFQLSQLSTIHNSGNYHFNDPTFYQLGIK